MPELKEGEVPEEIESRVNHPAHYTSHPSGIEAIELTAFESFCIGNCLKYLLRRKFKNDELGDLLKAKWYLDKEIQRVRDGTCSGSSD